MDGYRSQYAGGRHYYPVNILKAVDTLRAHKPDEKTNTYKKKESKREYSNASGEGETASNFAQKEKNMFWMGF